MMATMALSTLFVTTAFAQENDVEVIEEAKILEEIVSYLEDGVTIDVAPNESGFSFPSIFFCSHSRSS